MPRLAGSFAFLLLLTFLPVSTFPQGTDGETKIDPGFIYRDMEFAVLFPNEVLGTMVNRTGQNYRLACFMMKLYSKTDQLLKTVNFCVSDLADGQSKFFKTTTNVNPTVLKGYKIQFQSGQ